MPGRGRGRLKGPGPSSGPQIGSDSRTSDNGSSSVTDDFEPVPFYTNMYGKISKAQYDRDKTNP